MIKLDIVFVSLKCHRIRIETESGGFAFFWIYFKLPKSAISWVCIFRWNWSIGHWTTPTFQRPQKPCFNFPPFPSKLYLNFNSVFLSILYYFIIKLYRRDKQDQPSHFLFDTIISGIFVAFGRIELSYLSLCNLKLFLWNSYFIFYALS